MKKILSLFGLATILTCLSSSAFAASDMVVITNPGSGVDRLTRDEVTAIYMGRSKKLSSGLPAIPIDQAPTNPEKARFYRDLIDKELPEVNSYWARLTFSGRGTPPRQVSNASEVIETVAANKGAIGYIPRANVDRRVHVVLDLGAQ